MVFAFAGDSTITRFFATDLGASSPRSHLPQRGRLREGQSPRPCATGVTPCQTYAREKSLPGCWVTRPSSSSSSSNLSTVWAFSPDDSMIESTWSLSDSFRLFKIIVVSLTSPSTVLAPSTGPDGGATAALGIAATGVGAGLGASIGMLWVGTGLPAI